MVPKTQHLVSLFSKKITARFVFFDFGSVLPSVKLDYQAMFETAEIGNKRANRTLTPELRAGQLPRTQSCPEKTLRFRLLPPQPSRALARCGWLIRKGQLYQYPRIFVLLVTRYAARGIAHAACAPRAQLTWTLTLILSLKGRGVTQSSAVPKAVLNHSVSDDTRRNKNSQTLRAFRAENPAGRQPAGILREARGRMTACRCGGICGNTCVRLGYKCEPGLLTTAQMVR